jgi:hypothetical protein
VPRNPSDASSARRLLPFFLQVQQYLPLRALERTNIAGSRPLAPGKHTIS